MSKLNPQSGDVFYNTDGPWPCIVIESGHEFLVSFITLDDKTFYSSSGLYSRMDLIEKDRFIFCFNIDGAGLEEMITTKWKNGDYKNVPQDN